MLDYFTFGMLMPGKSISSDLYRYGFNGMEKDDEIAGEGVSYDYGFRIYNAQIGKFLSVDPLAKAFPWYTPYQFAGNKPIWKIDIDGMEEGDSKANNANDAYVEWGKHALRKYTYKQIRDNGPALNLKDKFTDCSESVYCGIKQANPSLAKEFLKDGGGTNVNTSTIKATINRLGGEFRKASPKVGDIIMWGGHVEIVSWVDGENFRTIGSGRGSVPREMGQAANGYQWLSTNYAEIDGLGSGKFIGFWTPPSPPVEGGENETATPEDDGNVGFDWGGLYNKVKASIWDSWSFSGSVDAAKSSLWDSWSFPDNWSWNGSSESTSPTPTKYKVSTSGGNLIFRDKSGGSTGGGKFISNLENGTQLTGTGNVNGDWTEVKDSNGRTGWVSSKYITKN